jgi:LemA protein
LIAGFPSRDALPTRYGSPALTLLLIIIGIVAALALAALLLYNRMVSRRNAVDNSWAQIEAALQRRHDLIPNLVESVKGYAKHEQQTFEEVTKARSTAVAAKAPGTQAAAEDTLTGAVGRLMAVAEQYPELRATENFQQLQSQLSETEDQIAITRRVYNDTVQTYNTFIQIFPPSVIANAFNFEPRQFFDAPKEAEATPEVSFDGGEPESPKAEASKS